MSDTPTPSQAAEMPVIAYLRATKDEMPVWDGDDCVCQDPVYPSDPDGSDADCISMPVVRLSDAESQLAELRAEVERLRADSRRLDHLQARGATVEILPAGLAWKFQVGGFHGAVSYDIRRAIDAARAALAADGKDGAR
ncbi:hypothetical protein EJP67_18400 [Variovorax guangxiensis]|uniref:Ead/Ea22-like family protein n=1 Tax=Variovorax guangxiensis TaxID=1775474 RepID=A0A3S0ZPS6_9BURK|nr:hypothetical protein [Variovorax guangxiensis]RUR69032.1 hypothetical protein EJP67_18400 [Variovorax guangxiensis]